MHVEFTKFVKGENWVSGFADNERYIFESKLFDEGSVYGINEGRVSKLRIVDQFKAKGNGNWFDGAIVNYDRGWDIKPETKEDEEAYKAIIDFLENAPTTRF